MFKKFLRSNGLSLVLLLLFLVTWLAQILTGFQSYNGELASHGMPSLSLNEYMGTGNFWEATFENWESEFLQMAVFVVLSSFLYQRGSSGSNPLPEEQGKHHKRYH